MGREKAGEDGRGREKAGSTGGSRLLVLGLIVLAVLIALAPRWWGSGGRGETMRHALDEVLGECRAAYDSATTAADTARVDSMVPMLDGMVRPGDPACGAYREKRMFRRSASGPAGSGMPRP